MTRRSESNVLRLFLRLLATAISAALAALASAFIAYWIGYALIEMRIIRPDSFVDDDAALKNIGVAMIGGLAGLVIGAVIAWRASRRLR
ncbi:MAG TPA: hypothetical protein DDZ68_01505 [Parvularcula sp.]|nr:hypothetical protein [Parvularcula sp.]HBS30529.1 hypothetical protein [Parvularcula sp.]HBS35114.1 hypothetical protein [Parvularcula sp.]